MNIDTDTQFACAKGVGDYMDQHPEAFKHQIHPETGAPLKKFYDPRKWNRDVQKSMVARLDEAFRDPSKSRPFCLRLTLVKTGSGYWLINHRNILLIFIGRGFF